MSSRRPSAHTAEALCGLVEMVHATERRRSGAPAPCVSIGLPVYNGADYLAEAIASILAQSFEDFELIIADNASEDATPQICARFAEADPRVRYLRSERNIGAAPNYNRLVALARGRYFKWAAHDDVCEPEFLTRCVAALEADPEVALCYPSTRVIDAEGRVTCEYRDGVDLPQAMPADRLVAYLRTNFMRRTGMCNPIFGLVRTESLRRTRLIQDFVASDQSLIGHFALIGKIAELPDVLFRRRVHPAISTMTHRSLSARRAWFNPNRQRASFRPLRALADTQIARRLVQLCDFYRAIDELVEDAAERRSCRRALTRLIVTDPKWIYIDLKYTLGGGPSRSGVLRSLNVRQSAGRPAP